MAEPVSPKAFISYSWSNGDHERWVMDLATALVENNVDVVLDKWALKEGHDSIRFMEQMVTDPSVTKVVIVADKTYVEKADGRLGGVGTETQIISSEVYAALKEQNKFAVVVSERDIQGKAYLPTYYKGRIYIDLSDEGGYAAEFDRLLRWLYDKPLNVRPPQGKTPAFLLEGEHKTLGTASHAKRVIDALVAGRTTALGTFVEYLNVFNANLDRFRIVRDRKLFVDEQVLESLADLLPAKNEYLSVVASVATYAQTSDFGDKLHSFLEGLHQHTVPAPNTGYQDGDFDNYRFLIHELFLSTFALFVKHGRVDLAQIMLADYYLPEGANTRNQPMVTFEAFRQNLTSLEQRKQRTQSRRVSLHADMLVERLTGAGLRQDELIQADVLLFLRGQALGVHWHPVTHVYLNRYGRPLEIFARAGSRKYYDKISRLLAVDTPEEFAERIIQLDSNGRTLGSGFDTVSLKSITALDDLAKKP